MAAGEFVRRVAPPHVGAPDRSPGMDPASIMIPARVELFLR